ncbi:MAG TPA: pyridoxamine 5'-phosphate oxidase family protein [Candidatus Nitrosotalea sp.]|nr:pyridoxamine 5'-phosphate oxidase family protein [Candidatus Nitrosotalea sp.]
MRLDSRHDRSKLASPVGLLALEGRSHPVVGPAAFAEHDGVIYMTTSRHAAKVRLLRRRPRAAFALTWPDLALVLSGPIEIYDPRSLTSSWRAVRRAPALLAGMAAYLLQNAAYMAGYLGDRDRVPGGWWPHDRVLIALRVQRRRGFRLPPLDAPRAMPPALLPGSVAAALALRPLAYVSWVGPLGPELAPSGWAPDGDGMLALPLGRIGALQAGRRVTLALERPHPYRATQMVGASLWGALASEPDARRRVLLRYGRLPAGRAWRMELQGASWWTGFERGRTRLERAAVSAAPWGAADRSAEKDASPAAGGF